MPGPSTDPSTGPSAGSFAEAAPGSRSDRAVARVVVVGSFDNLGAREVRFLEEASRLGALHVLLRSDADVHEALGRPPAFPESERRYLLEALRFVTAVAPFAASAPAAVGSADAAATTGVVREGDEYAHAAMERWGLPLVVIPEADLAGFPVPAGRAIHREAPDRGSAVGPAGPAAGLVIVTGCFDWLHSGHVRFFEEASAFGSLHVAVGNDASVARHKGVGHPLLDQEERRYRVGVIRHVASVVIATGYGWMDAVPEIERIRPTSWVVNEDGDRPEKRAYCAEHGVVYRVLRRLPKRGLPVRTSTDLRGF